MTRSLSQLVSKTSDMDDYDPDSMSVARARLFIKQFLNPGNQTEILPLRESIGRILAGDIFSSVNVPNYDNSAMDGYAFNAEDININSPTKLIVIGTILAGKAFDKKVERGQCVRIMTGGMMPNGADTVIMQEKTKVDDDYIIFSEIPKPKMNVRYAGEDLQMGHCVLTSGHMIRAADLGLLASLGISEISVYRKLKVAFFSTGDELASLGENLKIGQVYDSNRYSLYGMLSDLDVDIIDMGAIPDNPELLERTLLSAAEQASVVITSGGVSVGEADYMKLLLAKHGQVMFWKIAMKPGRPLAYGKIGHAHYFGLPGNPVAVMVMGQSSPAPLPIFNVVCTENIKKQTGRTEFQRGVLFPDIDGTWKVKPTGAQGSAILSSMSLANCFIVLDETVGNLEAGSMVAVQVLHGPG